MQFAISRELIRNIYNSFHKLRDRAERMAARAVDNAADLLIFGKELRQVALWVQSGHLGGGGLGHKVTVSRVFCILQCSRV